MTESQDSPALLAWGHFRPPAPAGAGTLPRWSKTRVQLRQIFHKHFWNKTALGVQFFSHFILRNTGFKYIQRAQQRLQFRPRLSWHELRFFSYMILILLSHFPLWKEKVLFQIVMHVSFETKYFRTWKASWQLESEIICLQFVAQSGRRNDQ